MTRVVTTSPGFGRHGRVPDALAATGWDVLRCADPAEAEARLPGMLAEADVLVAGLLPVTAATLAQAPGLRGVLKHGVGIDEIDVAACTAAGIPVTSAPGANANAVAELALGLMLAAARHVVEGHASVAAGGWTRRAGVEVAGRTLGIVGLGAIGRTLALKAQALGMTVLATDLGPDPAFLAAHGIEAVPLGRLLERADAVSLHVFGGSANAALIGAPELERMRPGAILLNLARGEVVDLDALDAALRSGRLGGAALDAYPTEPPDRAHPIFTAPNVTFTPHSGADTVEAFERVGLMVIEDIETLLAGGRPARCVNPEAFDR